MKIEIDISSTWGARAVLAYARRVRDTDNQLYLDLLKAVSLAWDEHDYVLDYLDEYELVQEDAVARALEKQLDDLGKGIIVCDDDGDPTAMIVREYQAGYYGGYFEPPDPGYDYWRFATAKERHDAHPDVFPLPEDKDDGA